MEPRKSYSVELHQVMILLLLIPLIFMNYGCGVAVNLAGNQLGHAISKGIDESKPIVATTYQTDIYTLTSLIETEAKKTIENSEVVLKFVKTKDEPDSRIIEIRTLKGSVITLDITAQPPIDSLSITLIEIYSHVTEDGVLGWTRADVSTRAPFNQIISKIRRNVKENHIKIVGDTVKEGLTF